MTVAALTPSASYLENGVTLAFAAPFRFLDPTHLEVKRVAVDGTVTTLAHGTQWTATGGGTDAGGTVNLVASVAGATLKIGRVTPRAQATDYTTADTFPAESHEAALDRQMLIDQEQDAALAAFLARALVAPEGETIGLLPGKEARKGLGLVFDPVTGNPGVAATPASALSGALAAQAASEAAKVAAEAARDATLTAYDQFDDRYLGPKAADPLTDNDGNALIGGALYYNTTVSEMRIWTGAVWVAAYVSGTGFLAKTGDTMTGKLTTAASAAGGAGLVVPHGAAPAAPNNGDVWSTTTGLFARINAVTYQFASLAGTETLTNKTLTGMATVSTVKTPAGTNVAVGYRNMPVAATAGGASVANDVGQLIRATGGITINTGIYAQGDCFSILNVSGASITITQGAGFTLNQVNSANTGNRTLANKGWATVWFDSATVAYISGNGLS